MGEAVIISVLCILSIFGVHKIFEMLLSLRRIVDKRKLTLVYKMPHSEKNAEIIVRALADESDCRVVVVCEGAEGEAYGVCVKTAAQYRNVAVVTEQEYCEAI